jgi:hypothetical protein
MNSLFWTLVNSPDLTTEDAQELHKQWWEKVKHFHDIIPKPTQGPTPAPKSVQTPEGLSEEDLELFQRASKTTLDKEHERLLQESLKPLK